MSKYIDADKLKKIVEQAKQRALEGVEVDGDMYCDGRADAFVEVLLEIDSLQQEQPEVDLTEEITNFFSENPIPHEHITDWPLLKNTALHFFNHGLNARKDKLPEIELDKFTEKIKTFQGRYKHPEIVSIKGAMAFMARLFYQYPNVAMRWYNNLPKATMD